MFDLECLSLVKRFDAFTAVRDVSFEIPSGSFFSILGPSGCGKTTLMRMIAGFEEPTSGDIRLKGRSVLGTPANRRNVKMVFQHLALFPMMSVADNIAYGLRCRGAGRSEIESRVRSILERIGMPGSGSKRIGQLSGGQKQRIAIARCMVLEPDVLLLDEPLGALDLKLREHMKVELKLLQHQFRTTFVYITHDQGEALVMSDRVAVMNGGRFEQVGTPQDLYHAPRSAFVAGFVGDSNRWAGTVSGSSPFGLTIETSEGLAVVGRSAGAETPIPGAAVSVFVRPSAISVERGRPAGPNAAGLNQIEGAVESVLFNGSDSRILVRVPSGALVTAALPQAGRNADLRTGEPVTLAFASDETRCFREEA